MRSLGLALAVAALGFGSLRAARFVLTSPRFSIQRIRIDGARRAPVEELRGRVGVTADSNIFRVNLSDVEHDVKSSPWIRSVSARRSLPDSLVVKVKEYEPKAVANLGHLYLVDENGYVFKRATTEEAREFPIITGLDRLDFIASRAEGELRLRETIAFLAKYHRPGRPVIGEIHWEPTGPPTLYTREGGVQIRLGDGPLATRLSRLDLVWTALGPSRSRVRAIYLDNRTRQDRVTVRLAAPL